MNPADSLSLAPPAAADDPLLRWQLEVAVRADELARGGPHGKDEDLQIWLRAEQEFLQRHPCLLAG